MLLRRITEHIREQNWFAVFLDFVVVVVGIFVALQVTEWNELRKERKDEARLLRQIVHEIDAIIAVSIDWIDTYTARQAMRHAAMRVVQGDDPADALTDEQSHALWRTHITFWAYESLTTLDELMGTGRLRVIRDEEIRINLLGIDANQDVWAERARFLTGGLIQVVTRFPALMPRRTGLPQSTVTCNLDAMRENPAFQGEVLHNMGRTFGLLSQAATEIERYEAVKKLIEARTQ
jgi:hypothetical protein